MFSHLCLMELFTGFVLFTCSERGTVKVFMVKFQIKYLFKFLGCLVLNEVDKITTIYEMLMFIL